MSFVDQYTFVCMYINLFAVLVYIKLLKLPNLHELHPMNSNSVLNLPFYVQPLKVLIFKLIQINILGISILVFKTTKRRE